MVNENADEFWSRVKSLIKENKTTQEYVAKKCSVSLGVFKNWIFTRHLPDAAQTVRIAKALGTSAEYLVTGCEARQDNTKAISLLNAAIALLK